MIKTLKLFSDGSCLGNPGPGGWGFFLVEGDQIIHSQGGFEKLTTNNRMELMAVISGITYASDFHATSMNIFTDSQYVRKGITQWLASWLRNNWKTASRTPVKNQDLWQSLLNCTQNRLLTWHWIPRRSCPYSQAVDDLARHCAEHQENLVHKNFLK